MPFPPLCRNFGSITGWRSSGFIVAIRLITASGLGLVEVVYLSGLEQIANRHIDPFAWRRPSRTRLTPD